MKVFILIITIISSLIVYGAPSTESKSTQPNEKNKLLINFQSPQTIEGESGSIYVNDNIFNAFSKLDYNLFVCFRGVKNAYPIQIKEKKYSRKQKFFNQFIPGHIAKEGFYYSINLNEDIKITNNFKHNDIISFAKIVKENNCNDYGNLQYVYEYKSKYLDRAVLYKDLSKKRGDTFAKQSYILDLSYGSKQYKKVIDDELILKRLDEELSSGFDINTLNSNNQTLINLLINNKREHLIDEFIKRGANLKNAWEHKNNLGVINGRYILVKLSNLNRGDLVQKAINEGVDINRGMPWFDINIFHHEKIMNILIDGGLDICSITPAIHEYRMKGFEHLKKISQRYFKECKNHSEQTMVKLHSVLHDDKIFLEETESLSNSSKNNTPIYHTMKVEILGIAPYKQYEPFKIESRIKNYIKKGFDINSIDEFGNHILVYATEMPKNHNRHVEHHVIETLISMGADPNIQWEKLSVKIFSMDYIPKSLINMLVDSNVNFNIRSEYGSIFDVISPLVLKHDMPNNKYNLCLFENTLQSRIDSPELIKGKRLNNISRIFISLYREQCGKELKYRGENIQT
ncbi:MAG: hypothetical protein VX154_02010 [Pseudomonadota bacterium]|nr:hypothetical protein [Pseudomonadota bacterium]